MEEDNLSLQTVAERLGLERSFVRRCLSGYANLTLESVAQLVWALNASPQFSIALDDGADRFCNHFADRQSSDAPQAGELIRE